MKPRDKSASLQVLPEHESAVRSMVAEARGESYVALKSLAEAQNVPDGVVILEGDYGGQIYVVARASYVRCSEATLEQLLSDLDAREWSDPDGARVYFERRSVGAGVAGGMGGGVVATEPWVHPRLTTLLADIVAVLEARRERL